MDVESVVKQRYSEGAKERQEQLCCPVEYDSSLLKLLPDEILAKDYGCGDPSRYVREGDTVLDLGSGGGKICYMAAQLVGSKGRVIGIDMNDDMLTLARKYRNSMQEKMGGVAIDFHKGYIQDLALNVEAVEEYLAQNPIKTNDDLNRFNLWKAEQKQATPLIADNSVDLVVSNCVLNLVGDEEKRQLIQEIHRVLKPGGRVAISDIVSDEEVGEHLKKDPQLWSGCISGAFQEHEFLEAFGEVGFLAMAYDKWDSTPWQVVEGIEFRSVTLTAVKGEGMPCYDRGHAVIYRGPYASTTDDEGHVYYRGERMAVCERTFKLLTSSIYKDDFIGISPPGLTTPVEWCAPAGTRRAVSETKSGIHQMDSESSRCC